jgi:hypothetical protein
VEEKRSVNAGNQKRKWGFQKWSWKEKWLTIFESRPFSFMIPLFNWTKKGVIHFHQYFLSFPLHALMKLVHVSAYFAANNHNLGIFVPQLLDMVVSFGCLFDNIL